ncbi:translation initiation factor 1 [Cupriavidus necator]|uniref:translation initiation factor 1 n=1 Tax=Cupriavidus necator TaxID=106590 RepID=UPI00339D86B9
MSVIEEWEAMHLTPEGWQEGSYRHAPWRAVEVPPPAAGVLTVRRHVTATYCGPSRAVEDRTPEIADMALIEALLERHGAPVFKI